MVYGVIPHQKKEGKAGSCNLIITWYNKPTEAITQRCLAQLSFREEKMLLTQIRDLNTDLRDGNQV